VVAACPAVVCNRVLGSGQTYKLPMADITDRGVLCCFLQACCAASGAAGTAQGDSSPSSRALKAVAGVNLVTSASQLASLDEEVRGLSLSTPREWAASP